MGVNNKFRGHLITITGYDSENFYFHDNGPKDPAPNKTISKEKIDSATDLCFFDWGLIVV